jgi:hypothetical protein
MTRGLSTIYLMHPSTYALILKRKKHAAHVQGSGIMTSTWGFNVTVYGQLVWVRWSVSTVHAVTRLQFFGSVSRQADVPSSISQTVRDIEALTLNEFLRRVSKAAHEVSGMTLNSLEVKEESNG